MTRNHDKKTPAQRAWATANRGNYRPRPADLTPAQREARSLHSLYTHVQSTYFGPQAAINYEALTGRADVRSIGIVLDEMLERLEKMQ